VGLVAALGLVLGLSPALGGTAHADSDGYIDNFSGTIVVQYAHKNATVNQYDTTTLPLAPPSLKQTLDDQWSSARGAMCQALQQAIQPSRWACNLPPSGELRAKLLAANSLGLKYIVVGNHVNFDKGVIDVLGGWADVTVDVTFDVELDATLNFATAVDGAVAPSSPDYHGTPVSVQSALIHLKNTQINTNNIPAKLVNLVTDAIPRAESRLNQVSQNGTSVVAGRVSDVNGQFHDGARALGDTLRTSSSLPGSSPWSNWYFNLDVTVQPSQIVVRLRRDFDPPAVPLCPAPGQAPAYSSSGGVVEAACAVNTQGEIERLQPDGTTWVPGNHVIPCAGCSTDPLSDYPPSSLTSATYRVCASNQYGKACTAPVVVQIDHSIGGGGGGQGSSGQGNGGWVPPQQRCPPACPKPQ
jgi:hypothetical protein